MATDDPDVVIIGARVAGSTLSTLLGRGGVRVLLLDSSRFPSDSLSTHFFRGAGALESFRRSNALESVLGIGAPKLTKEYRFEGGRRDPETAAPQEPGSIGFNMSVRRVELDAALAKEAGSTPGVELLEGVRATRLLWEGRRVSGLAYQQGDQVRRVNCRLVVGADGRHSWVAREASARLMHSEPGHRAMYYAYFRDFFNPGRARDGPEFSVHGDEIAYAFPSDHELTCVAISMNLTAFEWFRAAPQVRFMERMRRHPGISERLEGGSQVGKLHGAGPMPNYTRVPAGPGWALVGDSEMHQDPFSGRGIDNAAGHAVLLADAICEWFQGSTSERQAGDRYKEQRDAVSEAGYLETVRASRDLGAGSS